MGWNNYNPGAISPCKDCTIRALNCHSNCLGYADFRKKVESVNKNRENQKKECDIMVESNIRRKKRFKFQKAKVQGQL